MRSFNIRRRADGEEFIVFDIIHYKNMDFWRAASLKDNRILRISSENMDDRQEDYDFMGFE